MSTKSYEALLYALAFVLLLFDKALMVFEIRSSLHVDPNLAIFIGSVTSLAAIYLVKRTNGHD
jgi:hypothetical protein